MAEKIQKTRDPVRRWTLITLGVIVVLFLLDHRRPDDALHLAGRRAGLRRAGRT